MMCVWGGLVARLRRLLGAWLIWCCWFLQHCCHWRKPDKTLSLLCVQSMRFMHGARSTEPPLHAVPSRPILGTLLGCGTIHMHVGVCLHRLRFVGWLNIVEASLRALPACKEMRLDVLDACLVYPSPSKGRAATGSRPSVVCAVRCRRACYS